MKKIQFLFVVCALGKLAFGQADLIFVPNSVSVNPVSQHIGNPVTITMSVKNNGTTGSDICRTRIFYSPSNNYSDAILFADIYLEPLAPGEVSNNIQFIRPITYSFTQLQYYFFIELNHFGETTESNYFNNEAVVGPVTILPAWAAQNLPYPIIFIHGLIGNTSTWYPLINDLKNIFGWSYGGNMNFCLNQDGSYFSSNIYSSTNNDYHDYTIINDLHPDDYFTVNFDVDNTGSVAPNYTDIESNQSAITKQGLAIRDAIAHVRLKTGRDKVILVGHSMGGLAAREYLQNPYIQPPVNQHHVAKLTTIGTPHGGSNGTLLGLFGLLPVDELSEAVRDLRHPFFPMFSGAYLFGANENLPQLTLFRNLDVNCNGDIGDNIIGLNNKALPQDILYSSLIGTGTPSYLGGGDGVVDEERANINNYPLSPYNVIADTFMLVSQEVYPPWDSWHSNLQKQTKSIIQGLDEPNDFPYAYKLSLAQMYYGTFTIQSNHTNNPVPDDDFYKVQLTDAGFLNIKLFNIAVSQCTVRVYNSNHICKYSKLSGGKSFLDVSTFLGAGDYFIDISATPTPSSWQYPYAIKLELLEPNVTCSGTSTLYAHSGTITDGSGANNYSDNCDCRWKIQPSGTTTITLSFTSFNVNNPGDTVYVYNGGTTGSPLLLACTGNTLPGTVTATVGSMLVRFKTDAANTSNGWTATYTSTGEPTSCDGVTTFTSPSGMFSDGSGNTNYANNTHCSWLISPPGAFAITLNFSAVQTEPVNDIINIYDGNDESAPLLATLSGSTVSSTVTSSGGAAFIEFITNSSITDAGWTVSYTSLIPSNITGIVTFEYWFDNNFASKVATSIAKQNVYNLVTALSTGTLSAGLHSFHIRFKDNQGHWSSIASDVFHKMPVMPSGQRQIVGYEYWFDNDYATKISQPVTPQQTFLLNTALNSNTITPGMHSFHIRYKDNAGQWSSVSSDVFHKMPVMPSGQRQIVGYEYWFDNNYGAKVAQPVSPQQTSILNTALETNSLPLGLHNFHIRYKDNAGQWSSIASDVVFKIGVIPSPANQITAYRYWFDMNSSSMISQSLPSPVNPYNLVQNIYVGNLSVGDHSIHFQFKDVAGQWSSVVSGSFTFAGPVEQTSITSQTIENGQINCFDALQKITVAGNGATFIIQTGGSATMIAGQNILYFPTTAVQSGGYMHGYIAPSGPWCTSPQMPAAAAMAENDLPGHLVHSGLKVYPNPTTGNFILELEGDYSTENSTVDIFGIRGEKILHETLTGERKCKFSLSERPVGVYFIRVISGARAETVKVIKQ